MTRSLVAFFLLALAVLLAACGRAPDQVRNRYRDATGAEVLAVAAQVADLQEQVRGLQTQLSRLERAYGTNPVLTLEQERLLWQAACMSTLNVAILIGADPTEIFQAGSGLSPDRCVDETTPTTSQ